jgi:hypothetical protein
MATDSALRGGSNFAVMSVRAETALSRAGPVIVFLIGALAIWLPPRPPMIDLPQFAGQIALLKGLLTGATPWAANLRIDAVTPYLLGYAVTLPLAFVLPIAAALKVVLTAALAGFGLAAAAIRRELGASRALDAYALIGFFGFDYSWGMVTFLVAAPLGLLVIWLSLQHARAPSVAGALWLVAAGIALLMAHGLVFLFATGVGGLLALVASRSLGGVVARLWPFAVPIGAAALAFLYSRHAPGGGGFPFAYGSAGIHLMSVLFSVDGWPNGATVGWLAVLAALPFVGGLRFEPRPLSRVVVSGAVFAAVLLAPVEFWVAAGLHLRFALFLPAAWAWMFSDRRPPLAGLTGALRPHLALAASAFAGLVLAQSVVQANRFAAEAKDFEAVMAAARPGQRALGLVLDMKSSAHVNPRVYWHFPLWYQAEHGGLVDPSFAAGAPSIVRYRANPAGLTEAFNVDRGTFDWRGDHGEQWTYFFVRAAKVPPNLFAGADCPPAQVAASGEWRLFERRACGGSSTGPAAPPFGGRGP